MMAAAVSGGGSAAIAGATSRKGAKTRREITATFLCAYAPARDIAANRASDDIRARPDRPAGVESKRRREARRQCHRSLVEPRGVEPLTSAMPLRRSPN